MRSEHGELLDIAFKIDLINVPICIRGSLVRVLTILLGIALLWSYDSDIARGQESSAPKTEASPMAAAEPKSDASEASNVPPANTNKPAPEQSFLVDENQKKLPLPADITKSMKQWLEWRKKNETTDPVLNQTVTEIPDFSITSIMVEGEILEEFAELELTYKVQVNSDEGAQIIPLGAKEGTLTDFKSTGPGYAQHHRTDPKTGYYWLIEGKGTYELKLDMVVKNRLNSSSQMLFLSLPSEATIRKASLLLPTLDLEISLPDTTFQQRELETGKTEVVFPILSDAINLTWKFIPLVKDKPVVLRSSTKIELRFLSDHLEKSVQMMVEQTVQPDERGSFKTLRIRLPQNFEVEEVSGEGYLNREVEENNEMTVFLKEPATGQVTLNYVLTLRPLESDELILDGAFQLLSTSRSTSDEQTSTQILEQPGTITIQKGESFLIRNIPQERSLIRDLSADSLDSQKKISQAYSFYSQPFHMKLKVEKIPPLSSLDAHYVVSLNPDLAESGKLKVALKANLALKVLRGELSELTFDWNEFSDEGWSTPSFNDPINQLTYIENIEYDEESGQLRIRFLDPISGEKEISFLTEKTIDLKKPELDFTLPRLDEEIQRLSAPAVTSIISSPNLETQITPNGKTKISPLTAKERELYSVAASIKEPEKNISQWSITTPKDQKLHLNVITRKQEVIANTQLELLEHQNNYLTVRQVISLDVKYDPLKLVRLYIPSELSDSELEVRGADNNIIKPEKTTSMGSASELLVTHSQGLGKFQVSIQYRVERSRVDEQGGRHFFQIPYFTLEATPFSAVTLTKTQQRQYDVELNPDNWQPIVGDNENTWQLNTPDRDNRDVTVQLIPSKVLTVQDFQVPLALYKIDLRSQKELLIEARYLIEGSPEQILITMPLGFQSLTIDWDGVNVVKSTEQLKREWLIDIPSNEIEGRHQLVMSYRLNQSNSSNWLRSYQVKFPRFSSEIWTPQAITEITSSHSQHLLIPPEKWAPLFSWQREGLFWYRRSDVEKNENELYQALSGNDGINYRYHYDFARTDAGDSISFQTISLSMLVFSGAGIALLCGFLFRRISYLHNSFAFCVLLFAIALAGLWYWPIIQVLIQPAIIGILFALIAVAIEELLRRRHATDYYELNSSRDFVVTPSWQSGMRSQQIGSEDSTALRHPSGHQIPVSTSEKEDSP
ncbi:hypothetical protein Pla110_14210 [Polystyrenella longa]|uniref:Uncharacterized protein n=1 Tax=Polystyrenella longa TaxID=2528007 RepID=A0A518CKG0_9PLAN|nr:hypothetical protein [Polystyrenella longa]QDU79707.1 hypothetical protein Pla110_14210 [Polystyrenella longa]